MLKFDVKLKKFRVAGDNVFFINTAFVCEVYCLGGGRCHTTDYCVAHKQITYFPSNTKHLYNIYTMLDQRQRRWADVVQMLYKCFVFA